MFEFTPRKFFFSKNPTPWLFLRMIGTIKNSLPTIQKSEISNFNLLVFYFSASRRNLKIINLDNNYDAHLCGVFPIL